MIPDSITPTLSLSCATVSNGIHGCPDGSPRGCPISFTPLIDGAPPAVVPLEFLLEMNLAPRYSIKNAKNTPAIVMAVAVPSYLRLPMHSDPNSSCACVSRCKKAVATITPAPNCLISVKASEVTETLVSCLRRMGPNTAIDDVTRIAKVAPIRNGMLYLRSRRAQGFAGLLAPAQCSTPAWKWQPSFADSSTSLWWTWSLLCPLLCLLTFDNIVVDTSPPPEPTQSLAIVSSTQRVNGESPDWGIRFLVLDMVIGIRRW